MALSEKLNAPTLMDGLGPDDVVDVPELVLSPSPDDPQAPATRARLRTVAPMATPRLNRMGLPLCWLSGGRGQHRRLRGRLPGLGVDVAHPDVRVGDDRRDRQRDHGHQRGAGAEAGVAPQADGDGQEVEDPERGDGPAQVADVDADPTADAVAAAVAEEHTEREGDRDRGRRGTERHGDVLV